MAQTCRVITSRYTPIKSNTTCRRINLVKEDSVHVYLRVSIRKGVTRYFPIARRIIEIATRRANNGFGRPITIKRVKFRVVGMRANNGNVNNLTNRVMFKSKVSIIQGRFRSFRRIAFCFPMRFFRHTTLMAKQRNNFRIFRVKSSRQFKNVDIVDVTRSDYRRRVTMNATRRYFATLQIRQYQVSFLLCHLRYRINN